jgi:hypothetical protein
MAIIQPIEHRGRIVALVAGGRALVDDELSPARSRSCGPSACTRRRRHSRARTPTDVDGLRPRPLRHHPK